MMIDRTMLSVSLRQLLKASKYHFPLDRMYIILLTFTRKFLVNAKNIRISRVPIKTRKRRQVCLKTRLGTSIPTTYLSVPTIIGIIGVAKLNSKLTLPVSNQKEWNQLKLVCKNLRVRRRPNGCKLYNSSMRIFKVPSITK